MKPTVSALIAAVAILVLAAASNLARPGFSPDEELTAAAVRGISATGVPALPSGILYLRGLPYSYSAWLGGLVLGQSLLAYRAVSLVFAIAAVILIFLVARQVTTSPAAVCAALLLASLPLHIASAVFARFYSAFTAAALCTMWLFNRLQRTSRGGWLFLTALVVSRLLHEFAVLLALLPLCWAICADRAGQSRRTDMLLFMKSVALLFVVQAALSGLERWSMAAQGLEISNSLGLFGTSSMAVPPLSIYQLADPAGLVVIALALLLLAVVAQRMTGASWPVVAAFTAFAFLFQTGVLLMVALVAALARPARSMRALLAGLMIAAGSIALWVLHTVAATDAQLSFRLARQLASSTVGYPWEGFGRLGETLTLIGVAAAIAAAATGFRFAKRDDVGLRVMLLFSVAALAALGLSAVELHWRYLLLAAPVVLIPAAHFADSAGEWLAQAVPASGSMPRQRAIAHLVSAVLVILFVGDQYAAAVPLLAPPTETRWRSDFVSDIIDRNDRVICNDDLACDYLIGRVDYWLVPEPTIEERYTAARSDDRVSVYTGSKAIADARALERTIECIDGPIAVVVLATGKFNDAENRALALEMARRFRGTVTWAGDEHLIVRISAGVTQQSKGGLW